MRLKNKKIEELRSVFDLGKKLIKQLARRIYDDMKEQITSDREQADALLKAIFGDVRAEIEELKTRAQQNIEKK